MKKYYVLLAGAMLAATIQTQAQTKIGGTGAPDPSAMLEVTGGTGNNKGILLPRISLTNVAIWGLSGSTPVAGMFVYNTNAAVIGGSGVGTYYWNGTQWVKSTSAATSGWNLTGNAGTNLATDFVGTTDAQPLVLRTNSAEHMRITAGGNVGINNGAPLSPLSFASTQGPKVALYDNGSATEHYGLGVSGGLLNYQVMTGATHSFRTGGKNADGTELMRIQSNGNVGIGTSTPTAMLDVAGPARIQGNGGTPTTITGRDASGNVGNVALGTGLSLTGGILSATVSSPGWALGGNTGTNPAINYLGTTDAQPLLLRTNALERMRISAAGNVGIFNNNPLSPLSFASSVGSKIALYDGGSATDYFGLGISTNMLDYHVMPNGVHAFFAGGKNGDGTELMRIQSDGKVGISNSTPLVPLAFASSVGPKISLYDLESATEHYGFGVSPGQLNYHVMAGTNHVFYNGGKNGDGTELMRIQGNGNVGIGTSTPTSMLDVAGTARIQGSAGTPTAITGRDGFGNINNITLGANLSLTGGVLSASGGGTAGWGLTGNVGTNPATNFIGTTDAQPLVLRTNAVERLRITADGRVGIGTSFIDPEAKLDIDNGNIKISADYGLRWDGISARIYMQPNLALPGNNLFMESGANMIFLNDRNNTGPATNLRGFVWAVGTSWVDGGTPVEKMRLTNAGNLGLGTITPNYTLDVVGDINASANVRAGGVVLTSDARLKRNIINTQHGLSTIMKLNPVEYEKKNSIKDSVYDRHEIGLIAQEVAKVLPSIVTEGKDADKTLAVSYTELIPVLTKAIQEQQAQIATQQTQITLQDQKINALVAENQKLKTTEVELKENKAVTAQLMERVKQMEQMMGINEIEGTSKVAGK